VNVNLFIVGTPKSGTTSLYNALEGCEEIALPLVKEPNYFTRLEIKSEIENGTSDAMIISKIQKKHIGLIEEEKIYLKNYERNCKYSCDFSTSYSRYHEKAAKRIYNYNPSAKIIIMVREPLGRIISHYRMDKRIGYTNKDLNSLLESEIHKIGNTTYLRDTDYQRIINSYKKYFNDILLISFEDRIATNNNLLKIELERFLDTGLDGFTLKKENEATEARFEKINYLISMLGVKKFIRKYGGQRLKSIIRKLFYKKNAGKLNYRFSKEVKDKIDNLRNQYLEVIK